MRKTISISIDFSLTTWGATKKDIDSTIRVSGKAYKRKGDYVGGSPAVDTSVTFDIDEITWRGMNVLPLMKMLDLGDHIEEIETAFHTAAWKEFYSLAEDIEPTEDPWNELVRSNCENLAAI
jgi:hypothetical protein